MLRVLDHKNIIMGDPSEDNMIVFFKTDDDHFEIEGRKMSEAQLLAMASVLLDEGYSTSYDRCLKAVQVTDGNVEAARDLLSKITIT